MPRGEGSIGEVMTSVSGKKLLIIAVVCGVLAAVLGWLYLKAKESQYRAAYRPVNQVMVSVIVPKIDIDKVQPLTRDNVAVMDVPREYLPSNAVMASDWTSLENRVSTRALQKGAPITWDAIEEDGVSRFSENVALGKRIKTVKVNKINSFDGMLRPGDRIDLLGTFDATDIGMQEQPNYSSEVIITVLEDVEVQAAGREDAKGRKYETYYDRSTPDGFNMNFSTLSLMLTPAQVARVELAEKAGELVAVLRHPKDNSSTVIGQVTIASLLDPLPAETVDVVLDAEGNLLGRIIGDNVVDMNGRIIGRIVDGQAIGLDGKVMGRIVRGLSADDPLLRMRERATVVRDADGNVVGRVINGKVVDANGNVIGVYTDGKAIGLDGSDLGRVETNVALDENGRVIDMTRSQVQDDASTVGERLAVRDSEGRVVGWVEGDKIVDADGNVTGRYVDGQAVGLDGELLGHTAKLLLDENGTVLGEVVEVVRDADGRILGTIKDGKLIDENGKVLGTVKDGVVVDAGGKVLGKVEETLLDAEGKLMADMVRVVLDAHGNVIGTVVGDGVFDSDGRQVGYIRDGKVYDMAGNLIPGARIVMQRDLSKVGAKAAVREKHQEGARMIQFIPGGTGDGGVIPVQTLRLE